MAGGGTKPTGDARWQIGLTVGEPAERLGVRVHTLRYYEIAGLLAGIGRRANGDRRYSEAVLHFLDLLRCLRLTGMPIVHVRQFSALVQAGEAMAGLRLAMMKDHRRTIAQQRHVLERATAFVDERINRYRAMTGQEESAS